MKIDVKEHRVVDIGDRKTVVVEPPGYDDCDDKLAAILIEAGAATERKEPTNKRGNDGSAKR